MNEKKRGRNRDDDAKKVVVYKQNTSDHWYFSVVYIRPL